MSAPVFARRDGWTLVLHPAFRDRLFELATAVEGIRAGQPETWMEHPRAKLLRRILDLILREVPADPASKAFELGNTVGRSGRHWRRAKFMGRFRLFFRFDSASRTIVYVWVNDERTLRKAGSATDPYAVFAAMISRDDPPGDWTALVKACDRPPSPEQAARAKAFLES